ncbi:hypothetical protein ACFIOY_33290 [Bradyrhizobium sp. TZ2]
MFPADAVFPRGPPASAPWRGGNAIRFQTVQPAFSVVLRLARRECCSCEFSIDSECSRADEGPCLLLRSTSPDLDFTIVAAARIVALVIVQQLLVLFPAVAVDAPGAGWQNAIRDTRNHIWFVVAVTILPFIPIALLGVAVAPLFRFSAGTLTGMVAGLMWFGAMLLVASTLGAVIASRLYQVIGDRLNAPLRKEFGLRARWSMDKYPTSLLPDSFHRRLFFCTI